MRRPVKSVSSCHRASISNQKAPHDLRLGRWAVGWQENKGERELEGEGEVGVQEMNYCKLSTDEMRPTTNFQSCRGRGMVGSVRNGRQPDNRGWGHQNGSHHATSRRT